MRRRLGDHLTLRPRNKGVPFLGVCQEACDATGPSSPSTGEPASLAASGRCHRCGRGSFGTSRADYNLLVISRIVTQDA